LDFGSSFCTPIDIKSIKVIASQLTSNGSKTARRYVLNSLARSRTVFGSREKVFLLGVVNRSQSYL